MSAGAAWGPARKRSHTVAAGRVRGPGGGRKAFGEVDPTLLADLQRLVGNDARGDPESPLVSRQAVVSLIGATTSAAGLTVDAQRDEGASPRGVTVSDAQLAALNLNRDEFHGEWNHVITPQVY